MKSRTNFDEEAFIKVVSMLANDEVLPERYCNHLLEPKTERNLGMSYKARLVVNVYKKQGCISININKNWDSFGLI